MSWQLSEDVEEYVAAAGDLLAADPAGQTIALTVLEQLRAGEKYDAPALFAWWTDGGGVVTGAAQQTPPHNLLLCVVPDEATGPLAGALADAGRHLPGVLGNRAATQAFAAAWCGLTGTTSTLRWEQRLHRLEELHPPDPPPPGRARPPRPDETPLLVDWVRAFGTETGATAVRQLETAVVDRLAYGGWTLWDDGGLVSLAGRNRPAAGVVRVGPVYTPLERRGRGYGGAATAAVTAAALVDGAAEVVLFTDLANPTSNALYARLGYRPLRDQLVLSFSP